MYRYLLLALCAPSLAMGGAIEDIYDEAVLALSSVVANSLAPLTPFNYDWTQMIVFYKEDCYLNCSEGKAGPLGTIRRPPDADVLEYRGQASVLSSSVATSDFRYNYDTCRLALGATGSDNYTGLSKDNKLELIFSVKNSDSGCLATVQSLRLGLTGGITFDDYGTELFLRSLGANLRIKRVIESHIEEDLNLHLQKFVNRTYTLQHHCPI